MSRRILNHLRDNVYGLIAVFIALGGVAYAAGLPANSVGTKQLKSGAVTKAKLAKHAVTGAKVADKSLTGTQIKSSTLAPVPQALHADSAAPSGPAGGDLAGSYPNPSISPGAIRANDLGFRTGIDTTETDSKSPKELGTPCPQGSTVISGSATIDNGYGTPAPDVGLSASGLQPFFNGWYARGYETTNPNNGVWRLVVSAICIRK